MNIYVPSDKQGKGHLDLTLISTLAVKIFYSFGLLFVYCEIGERINSFFGEINDDFYELEWENFPLSIQRMMPTVLINTQQPVQLEAFGNFPCTRLTFKDVSSKQYNVNLNLPIMITFSFDFRWIRLSICLTLFLPFSTECSDFGYGIFENLTQCILYVM